MVVRHGFYTATLFSILQKKTRVDLYTGNSGESALAREICHKIGFLSRKVSKWKTWRDGSRLASRTSHSDIGNRPFHRLPASGGNYQLLRGIIYNLYLGNRR